MGYAKYVGRVGALAVALGIGTAVATPAWADTSETETTSRSPESGGAQPADNTTGGNTQTTTPRDAAEQDASPDDEEELVEEGELDELETVLDAADATGEDQLPVEEGELEELEAVLNATETTGEDQLPVEPPAELNGGDPEVASGPAVSPPLSTDGAPGQETLQESPAQSDQSVESGVTAVSEAVTKSDALGSTDVPAEQPTLLNAIDTPDDASQMATFALRTPAADTTPTSTWTPQTQHIWQPRTIIGAVLGAPLALMDITARAIGMLLDPGPSAPGDAPLLLGVLAFVRREIQRTFFNSSPYAMADVAGTSEGLATRIDVLGNDTDPNLFPGGGGDILTVADFTQAANGEVELNADGSFRYTPNAGFVGTDTFTYKVTDQKSPWHIHGLMSLLRGGHGATATVTVTVTADAAENQAPTAADDSVTTSEDTPVVIDASANDTDPDDDSLTISGVGAPSHGTVTVENGAIVYAPTVDYSGTDSFTYTVSDGALSSTATVTVTVTAVNDAPVAIDDSAAVAEDSSVVIDVLNNDSDVDGDVLAISGVGAPSHGSVTVADGKITYTPDANYAGTDSFTYTASDGTLTDTASVTVTVGGVNDAPAAANDAVNTAEDTAIVIDVLANDTDTDGGTLNISSVGAPSHGSVTVADGKITYTPEANYFGSDSFTYTVTDGTLTDTATVTITVAPVNDAPQATDDSFTMPAGATSATISVLSNDTDVDGESLTVTAVTGAINGSATVTGNTITYTPTTDFAGTETLTYTVFDGSLRDTATLTITVPAVSPTNSAPVPGTPAYVYTTHPGSGIISGTISVTDADQDTLTFTLSELPDQSFGAVAIDPETGDWEFRPTNQARLDAWRSAAGVDATFSITVSDGKASITIDIEAPVSPAFMFDRGYLDTAVEGAQSVIVVGPEGRILVDNPDGLTVIEADGSVGDPILLGFRPTDAVLGADSLLYVTDPLTNSIAVIDLTSGAISPFASASNASGLAIDGEGRLYVTSPQDRTLTVINEDGSVAGIIEIDAIPSDVAVGSDGTIYIAEIADDQNSTRLTVRNPDGSVVAVLYDEESTPLGGYAGALGLAIGGNGAIFLTDTSQGRFTAFNSDGEAVSRSLLDGLTRAVAVTGDGHILLVSADDSLRVLTPVAYEFDWNYDFSVDEDTGTVSGEVYLLDPSGQLTFELSTPPASGLGTVTVDEATGAWVFVPSPEALLAAAYGEYVWSYDYASEAEFVITASDGTDIVVSAPITGVVDYDVDVIEGVVGTPSALAIGPGGRIYVADRENNSVIVFSAAGTVVDTIALDFAPVGIATWQGGMLSVTNGIDNTLTLIVPAYDNSISSFALPIGGALGAIAVGGGQRIHVASEEIDAVVVFDTGAQPVLLIDVPNPTGVAVGPDGSIYVVGTDDQGAGYLKVYNDDGTLFTTTLLGGNPAGIAIGPNNQLYISDANGSPRDIAIAADDGWVIDNLDLGRAGGGVAVAADGRIYIANPDGGTITVLTPPEAPPVVTPVGTTTTIDVAGIYGLYGIAVSSDGRIIGTGFDAQMNPTLGVFDAEGSVIELIDLPGLPVGVEIGPDGRIYVSDNQSGTVTAFDPTDFYSSEVVATIPGAIGLAFDRDGNLYVTSAVNEAESGALVIMKVDGTTETIALPGASYDVHVAADGRVFISHVNRDGSEGGVVIRNTDGSSEEIALPPGILAAGLAVAPDGTIFVADPQYGRLLVRYPNGLTRSLDVNGNPFGLAFNSAGRLMISDFSSNTITVLDPIYDPVNRAPTIEDPRVYGLGSEGETSGQVLAVDSDGDLLTYSVVTDIDPLVGTVIIDATTGAWLFTPTLQARLDAAEALNGPTVENASVTFSVVASDGQFSDSITITVDIQPETLPEVQEPAFSIISTDATDGRVSGVIHVVDADGDQLVYGLADGFDWETGNVYVDYYTGAWEFTPTIQARYKAWADSAAATAAFTILAFDGSAETEVAVSVDIPAGLDPSILQQLAASGDVLVSENADGTVSAIHGSFVPRLVATSGDAAAVLDVLAPLIGAEPGFSTADIKRLQIDHNTDNAPDEVVYKSRLVLDGVATLASGVTLVVDGTGSVTGVFAGIVGGLASVDTIEDVDQSSAISIATSSLRTQLTDGVEEVADPSDVESFISQLSFIADLVIYDLDADQAPTLAWRVHITSAQATSAIEEDSQDPQGPRTFLTFDATYFVQANGPHSGAIIAEGPQSNLASPSAVTSAIDLLAVNRTFRIATFPSGSYLSDLSRGITTYRSEYADFLWMNISAFASDEMYENGWAEDAVSVHANISQVYDYYLNSLGHRSVDNDPDGNGTFERIDLFLDYRFRNRQDNAEAVSYPDFFEIRFGNDEGIESSVDVAAHEYTHGVIANIEWLTYSGESGALNEAYADILANLASAQILGLSRTDPKRWLHGEGPYDNASRSLASPVDYLSSQTTGNYRDHYDDRYRGNADHEGVHVNSTIFSHAFYRMVTDNDPASRGLDRTKTITDDQWAKVFYNSLFRLPANAKFVDARSAVISSALSQGFTRTQVEAIQDAFDQVGIKAASYRYGAYETLELGSTPGDMEE